MTASRLLFTFFVLASPAAAEPIRFSVTETAGLRRFGYPVTVSLESDRGAIEGIEQARLIDAAGAELPAQFTAMSKWPDGSVRSLDVDFATSPAPLETQAYCVETGVRPTQPVYKGLSVTETPDEIIVASSAIKHRIRRDGKPLLTSIAFGTNEFIGASGITTTLAPGPVEVLKRGPFNVTLKLGDVRLEYVSTKSWVKITQRAGSATDLAVDAHFALTKLPLLWDFGVNSWLYGTLAQPNQSVSLRVGAAGWQVFTARGTAVPSLYAGGKDCEGWGHLADNDRVAAFGMMACGADGEPRIDLSADGRVRIAAKREELTVYFHVVGQPVPVTAVTSPPAMLSPLFAKPTR